MNKVRNVAVYSRVKSTIYFTFSITSQLKFVEPPGYDDYIFLFLYENEQLCLFKIFILFSTGKSMFIEHHEAS